jgi:mRNA interferase MazF
MQKQYCMGRYFPGDVVLAMVALDDRSMAKTRPVVIIRTGGDGIIDACPVSSKPPSDAPGVPLAIDDFQTGGLDLFSESYVMTSRVVTIRSSGVIGKKGRLTGDSLAGIIALVPPGLQAGTGPGRKKKSGRTRR